MCTEREQEILVRITQNECEKTVKNKRNTHDVRTDIDKNTVIIYNNHKMKIKNL